MSALATDSYTTFANGAAFWYSGLSYVDLRVPGGADTQPASLPTSVMYSFDVAHFTKDFAASTFFDEFGIARAQAQNHPEPLLVTSTGAAVKAVLSATWLSFGL